jgi:hypothetical protein
MKKLLLAALTLWALLGMPSRQAFPQEKWADGHVDIVYVDPEGEFTFHLKENLQLCNSGQGTDWITVNKLYATVEGIKNLLSTVMAAKLADREVAVQGYSVPDPNVEWGCRLHQLGVK